MVREGGECAVGDGGEWARIRGEVEGMGGWAVGAGIENPVTGRGAGPVLSRRSRRAETGRTGSLGRGRDRRGRTSTFGRA